MRNGFRQVPVGCPMIRTVAFFVLLALALLSSLWGCQREYCTVIAGDTQVFPEITDAHRGAGHLPKSQSFVTLRRGDVVKIRWTANVKDQLIYQIETEGGRKGYIFHEGELGRFGLPVECTELRDPEAVARHLPEG